MVRGLMPVSAALFAGLLHAGPADELSGSFWVRFSEEKGAFSPTNGIVCARGGDGCLSLGFFARPDEILGDLTISTSVAVSREAWHHVAYSYSRMRRRAFVYLDGRWQGENADSALPRLSGTGRVETVGCAFSDVRTLPFAADPERLVPVPRNESLSTLYSLLGEVGELAGRAPASGFLSWMRALESRICNLCAREESSARPRVTARELESVRLAVRAAQTLSRADRRAFSSGFVVQVVDFPSAETVEPQGVPSHGAFTDTMRLSSAPDGHAVGSFVIHAFRPLTVKSVVVTGLAGPDGDSLPSACADVSLVKRWFRPVSSMAGDRRRRLAPGLLLHDPDLVRVDVDAARNYLRFDWPTGTAYEDCSDPDDAAPAWRKDFPVRDADALRPVSIPCAGCNQQFVLTVDLDGGACRGSYGGTVRIATDAGDFTLKLVLSVGDGAARPCRRAPRVASSWNEWRLGARAAADDVCYPAGGGWIRGVGAADVVRSPPQDRSASRQTEGCEPTEKRLLLRLLREKDARAILSVYRQLGELYENDAARFTSPADPVALHKAIAAYQGAYKVDPQDAENACRLVRACIAARDCPAALEFFGARISARGADRRLALLLGDCRFFTGDFRGAIASYGPFVRGLDPDRRERLASCYYALGRYRDCMDAVARCDDRLDGAARKAAAQRHLKALIDRRAADGAAEE